MGPLSEARRNMQRKPIGRIGAYVTAGVLFLVGIVSCVWIGSGESRETVSRSPAEAYRNAFAELEIVLHEAAQLELWFAIAGWQLNDDRLAEVESEVEAALNRLAAVAVDMPEFAPQVSLLRTNAALHLDNIRETVRDRRDLGFDKVRDRLLKRSRSGGLLEQLDAMRETNEIDPRFLRHAEVPDSDRAAAWIALGAFLGAAGLVGYLWAPSRRKRRTQDQISRRLLDRRRNALVANMSRELRNPINTVLGFTSLLESDLRDPDHRQWLAHLRAAGESVLPLIDATRDLLKIEAGTFHLHPVPTDLRQVRDLAHEAFMAKAARKRLALDCALDPQDPPMVLLDTTRLHQVVSALLDNAVKFTEQGRIELRIRLDDVDATANRAAVLISVQDTGVGIAAHRLDEVFEPQMLLKGVRRPRQLQGWGLGLAVVRGLVKLMGGRVSLSSTEGKGTTVRLWLPVKLAAEGGTESDTTFESDTELTEAPDSAEPPVRSGARGQSG